jgi:hypothetical protein
VSELFDHQIKNNSAVVGRNYRLLQTSDDLNRTNSLSQSEDESSTESEQDLQEISLNEDGIQNADTLQESSRFRRVVDVCTNYFSRIKNNFTSS